MNFKYLTITLMLILLSCNAQEKKDSIKNKNNTKKHIEMTTETFDIEKFNKNKIDNEYNFTLDDGTTVRQIGSENNYIEYIMPPKPNYYMTYKEYFKTGRLKNLVIRFPKNFLVNSKEYNEKGELIEEINYDEPYKFTFDQLVELLKKEKDTIDLYDRNTSITRGIINGKPIWEVEYKKVPMRREDLTIDGITGEIIKRDFHSHIDN